ncbi:MAG: LysR substrate-binding domain-containing protein [Pseudomonadota bacterium]
MINNQRWPPLNCLRGFQAAARLGSFSKAAKDLHMTQSAVSHQIKTLEDYLQQPLFIRVNRKVMLTDAGHEMLAVTDECLEILGEGLQRLEHYKKPNQLILHTDSSFASNWLVAKLGQLHKKHPDIDLWLYTTDQHPDLKMAEVHFAILYGQGKWQNLQARRLFKNCMIPLCAPDHPLAKQTAVNPENLLDHKLLHSEEDESWHQWFNAFGVGHANPTSGSNFSNPAHLLQAAAQGQGIALGSLVLGYDLLNSGQLVCPLLLGLEARKSYYLTTREDGLKNAHMEPFENWISDLAMQFEAEAYTPLTGKIELK